MVTTLAVIMQADILPVIIVYSVVALFVAIGYLLLSSTALAVRRLVRRYRGTRPISRRPGEVIHQVLKITGRRWDQFRTAALLFIASIGVLAAFGRRDWWSDMPAGVYAVIALGLIALLGFGLAKMLQLYRYRIRLARLLDQHRAVARQLVEAQLRGNRVYHSVPVGDAIIDNVVVGSNGIYTVQLIPAPSAACKSVSVRQGALSFRPTHDRRALGDYGAAIAALTKALSARTGGKVKLMPVVVVPDCQIEPGDIDSPLLVRVESCNSLVGWKDKQAFLMEDDISTINQWLATQGVDCPPESLRVMVNALENQIKRPALV